MTSPSIWKELSCNCNVPPSTANVWLCPSVPAFKQHLKPYLFTHTKSISRLVSLSVNPITVSQCFCYLIGRVNLSEFGTSVGELAKRKQCPFRQKSSGGWRKNKLRPLVGVSALCLLQCFNTVGWVSGRTSGPWKTLCRKLSSSTMWRQ